MKKEATFRYFVKDKEGNYINVDTLPEEKRKELGREAYRRLVEGLGFVPVEKSQ